MIARCAHPAASEQRERFFVNGPVGQVGQGLSALVSVLLAARIFNGAGWTARIFGTDNVNLLAFLSHSEQTIPVKVEADFRGCLSQRPRCCVDWVRSVSDESSDC